MFNIDYQSRVPVFEQISRQAEEYILAGILKPGDKLPSIRELTVQTGVNPNTIQRAYNELDRRGITVSAAGRGCYISRDVMDILRKKASERLPELEKTVRELHNAGLEDNDILETVKKALR